MSDDARDAFVARLEHARDALSDLLMNSEPGTGMQVHTAYKSIKAAILIATDEAPAAVADLDRSAQIIDAEARTTRERKNEEQRQRNQEEKRAWRQVPLVVREHIVLDALGDDRMSVWELSVHLYRTRRAARFNTDSLRMILKRLIDAGELDRVNEFPARGAGKGSRRRYVYFRRTALTGPIADLERAFHGASAETEGGS